MCKAKRLVAALVCAALLCAPALAVETEAEELFPAVNTYPEGYYRDVADGVWYAEAAKLCYETGLMNGTASNAFSPDSTFTVGECAAVTARIREALTGDEILASTPLPGETKAWYADYVNYMARDTDLTAILNRPTETITRMEYFQLLRSALPDEDALLPAINSITALPDTEDADVLRFYNAGVLTGTDDYGTFSGDKTLTRAECAAMVARIVDPALRQSFIPAEKPTEPSAPPDKPALSYEEELMQTEAVRINGATVTFGEFIQALNSCVAETDAALLANTGKGLDWNASYSDVDDLPAYFKQMTLNRLVESSVISTQARALGCTAETLPAFLTPDPSQALDHIYCAKHILVENEGVAQTVVSTLRSNPSLQTFNSLLTQYGTDPGMASNPNGYLFTDGDMVSEFENAVKALKIGRCSTKPVQSQFGYHIILRLDPTSYPGWEQAVQEMEYELYLGQWLTSATVTTNTAELDKLDVVARYTSYLASQGG